MSGNAGECGRCFFQFLQNIQDRKITDIRAGFDKRTGFIKSLSTPGAYEPSGMIENGTFPELENRMIDLSQSVFLDLYRRRTACRA